jgi:hypothetical protein
MREQNKDTNSRCHYYYKENDSRFVFDFQMPFYPKICYWGWGCGGGGATATAQEIDVRGKVSTKNMAFKITFEYTLSSL